MVQEIRFRTVFIGFLVLLVFSSLNTAFSYTHNYLSKRDLKYFSGNFELSVCNYSSIVKIPKYVFLGLIKWNKYPKLFFWRPKK